MADQGKNAQSPLGFLPCVVEPRSKNRGQSEGQVWKEEDESMLSVWFLEGPLGEVASLQLDGRSVTQGPSGLEVRIWEAV